MAITRAHALSVAKRLTFAWDASSAPDARQRQGRSQAAKTATKPHPCQSIPREPAGGSLDSDPLISDKHAMLSRNALALILTLVIALATALATLSPPAAMIQIGGSDKLYHFLAFAALALPVAALIPRRIPVTALMLSAYGWLIEMVQPYFDRSRDIGDQIANMSGILGGSLLGLGLWLLFLRPRHGGDCKDEAGSAPRKGLGQSS